MQSFAKSLLKITVLALFWLGVWLLVVYLSQLPSYLLPSPLAVGRRMMTDHALLIQHSLESADVFFISLIVGVASGWGTGVLLAYSRCLRFLLQPLLTLSQSVPLYAIAPLLILYCGYGGSAKIITTALMIYFPIAISTLDGILHTPQVYLDLAKSFQASKWQTLWLFRLPHARARICSGIKIALTFAPIGVVVSEYVIGGAGLGYLIQYGINRLQLDLCFASIAIVSVSTFCLRLFADYLSHHFGERL